MLTLMDQSDDQRDPFVDNRDGGGGGGRGGAFGQLTPPGGFDPTGGCYDDVSKLVALAAISVCCSVNIFTAFVVFPLRGGTWFLQSV